MVYAREINWHAVSTRSRHEKSVYRELVERNVEAFLPLITIPSSRRDRRAEYDCPLFPGYLFIRIPCERAWDVITVKGVARILGPRPLEYTPVQEQTIESLRTLVASQLKLDPFPGLAVGQMVRIKHGMLKGVEGQLVERRGALRLVVSVQLLSKAVSVDVRADDVEAL